MTVRFLVADAKSLAFPAGAAAARPPEAPPPAQHRGSPNVAAWTSAGVALVALGAFAYFGVTGKSELDQLHESCTGNCDPSSVDAAWTKLLVADVSLGVAVLGAGAATWFFLSGHDDTPEGARSSAASLGFAPSPHGVSLRWEKSF